MIPELQTSAESHCWRAEPRPGPDPPGVYRPGLRSQMESREQLRAAVAMEMLKIHIILLKREIVLFVNGKFFGAQHMFL